MLQLKVLGGLSMQRGGRALSGALAQPRRLAVLALLARAGPSGVQRERIVTTLWPDTDEDRARHTFSQTVYAIRRELGREDVIVGTRELSLNADLVTIDAVAFQAAIAARDFQRAVELYDGPFLDGFHIPSIDEFERWAERERASLDRLYTNALEQLARDATERDDHVRAVEWWRARAARDPLDANVAIALMQSLDAAGDRVGAIQHARVYEMLIEEELSLPPDREVVRLAENLRREATTTVVVDEPEPVVVPIPDVPTVAPAPVATVVPRRRERPPHGYASILAAAALVVATALGMFAVRHQGVRPPREATPPVATDSIGNDRPGASTVTSSDSSAVTTRSVTAYRMYEQGLRAHFRGEVAAARTFFEAAVAEDSLFPLAQYYSAVHTGNFIERRRRLERARRLARHATDRERLMIMAGWASAMAAPAQRAIAETLAIRYPREVTGHLDLGVALISDGEYFQALTPLRRVLELDPGGLRDTTTECGACAAMRLMVSAYMLGDSLAAAERVARRWIRLQPSSRAAEQALAEVLDIQGRGTEADSVLRAAGARMIEHADALHRRAVNFMRAGDYDAADRLLGDVLEAGAADEQVDAYWLLAISLRQQGRLAEALDATRRMRVIAPRTGQNIAGSAPSTAVLEAQILLELGQPRASAALFDSIARGREQLDSEPTAARRAAWNLTHSADARAAAGDTSGLARLIDSVQSLGVKSGFGRDRRLHHHVRGLLLAARRNDGAAIDELRRSILSFNFGYTRTNYELARTLLRLGRPSEAVTVLQPALRGSVEASNLYVTRTELHELLAQAWDAANGRDSAAAHYRVVASAWKRADPLLQLRRGHAEAKAAALLAPQSGR